MQSNPTVNHAKCPPGTHDRSLPDPPYQDEVTKAEDGLMGCADCRRPLFWCEQDHQWHHVDPEAECFMAGAWGVE